MARCLISFGANLGVPAVTIGQAVEQIKQLLGPRLVTLQLSRLVRTPAVGGPTGQPPFINAVAALDVRDCTAWDIWHTVREVEYALGRVRQERWEARRIDLDVLMFDDQRIWTPQFKLPHPRMIMRRFILQPALDVAAEWIEPVSGWSLAQLASSLSAAPASLVLLSHDLRVHQRLVDQAARTARCELVGVHVERTAGRAPVCEPSLPTVTPPAARWLALLPIAEFATSDLVRLSPQPRLIVVLAPASPATDAAWEDVSRPLARWLGLCTANPSQLAGPSSEEPLHLPLNGPRYLLSTDDLAWAEHEIVAAIDAMDCPVELTNT